MATQTTIRHSRQYSLKSNMDSAADKEERKREVCSFVPLSYLAGNLQGNSTTVLHNENSVRFPRKPTPTLSHQGSQECSGRRRKEHLKNLEQAQKEQNSEQSEEIERLRYQNDELRRENEALRAQIYGSSSSTHGLMPAPINVPLANDGRSYSLSPSISVTSISGAGSPPTTLGSDILPLSTLSLTSSMLPPSMPTYADSQALSTQPYSMVHLSGLRHNSQSSPESSGFRSSQSAVGSAFQSLNVSQPAEVQTLQVPGRRRSSAQPRSVQMFPEFLYLY